MSDAGNVTPLDGRAARSFRTRRGIVGALMELLDEGNVQPTVEEVAVRAAVAPRTVFQHYPDRELLFRAVSERHEQRIAPLLVGTSADGPLESRLHALVTRRAALCEAITPVRRATLLMAPFSLWATSALHDAQAAKRDEVLRVLAPELQACPAHERPLLGAALAAAASWSAWDALRTQQELDYATATAAVMRTLAALLAAR